MSKILNFTSDDFLELAIRCRHNARVLKDSAMLLFGKDSSKRHGLFLYYTAAEEMQKALFAMFAHRGIMRPEQIVSIFTKHETKIILFHLIFRNSKFYVKDGKFYYGDTLLKNLNLGNLIKRDPNFVTRYYERRSDCIYIRPNSDRTTYDPSQTPIDIESQKDMIHDEMTYLNAFFDAIWVHDFNGDYANFDYYTRTPKGKPKKYNFTFNGTGDLTKREKYKPDGFEQRLGKLSD